MSTATNVTGAFNLILGVTRQITGNTLSTPVDYGKFTFPNTTYSNGTAAGSLEEAWWASISVVGTNITTLDLSDTNGAGLVMSGSPVAFTKVKGFFVYNKSTNAADIVTATFNAANGWSAWCASTLKVNPGQVSGFADAGTTGITVTAGTGDLVKFANAATNTLSLDIMIVGNKS